MGQEIHDTREIDKPELYTFVLFENESQNEISFAFDVFGSLVRFVCLFVVVVSGGRVVVVVVIDVVVIQSVTLAIRRTESMSFQLLEATMVRLKVDDKYCQDSA